VRKVKLRDMSIEQSVKTLLDTGLFQRFQDFEMMAKPLKDGTEILGVFIPYSSPQHLVFIDSRFYFYIDYLNKYYEDKAKYTILDFSKKKRPVIALENFIEQLSKVHSSRFLFYVELFL
jgi:hypothetical protein